MESIKKKLKISKKTKTILLTISCTLIILAIVSIIFKKGEPPKLKTIAESTLKEIIEINDLQTVEYNYNAIATKYTNKKKDTPKYHVAYEGIVKAGINFKQIKIEVNEEEKIVLIELPKVEIQEVEVKEETMDYIFEKQKYETEDIIKEATKLCKDDLEKRTENEDLLLETARENAISTIEALFSPWIKSIDNEYKVEIR